jgi:hypothetical protein
MKSVAAISYLIKEFFLFYFPVYKLALGHYQCTLLQLVLLDVLHGIPAGAFSLEAKINRSAHPLQG